MTAVCDQDCFHCKFPDCVLSTMEAAPRLARPKDPRGEILRAGRIAAGYKTATALAEAMGTEPKTVKAWEAGRSWPRGQTAATLYRFLPAIRKPAEKAIRQVRERTPERREIHRAYRERHRERYRAASALYAAAHAEQRREYIRNYLRRRYEEDIDWAAKRGRANRARNRERYALTGEAIRREREALYGYQRDAAAAAGVPKSTWAGYELGTSRPNWKRIEPILPGIQARVERYVEERRQENAEF